MRELKASKYPVSTRELVDAIYTNGKASDSDHRDKIWVTIYRMRKQGVKIRYTRRAKRGYIL